MGLDMPPQEILKSYATVGNAFTRIADSLDKIAANTAMINAKLEAIHEQLEDMKIRDNPPLL